eukprot:8233127-Pyramimonas_sp.AAC.1
MNWPLFIIGVSRHGSGAKGYSLVIIVFYGLSSIGMTGGSLVRSHKLGSLVRTLQNPWLIIGDFNIPATVLAKTDFASAIGGRACAEDLVTACSAGSTGSLIACTIASSACLPYLVSITPVVQVPWNTRIGFQLRF